MEKIYQVNLHPEFAYCMDIRDFNKLGDYPKELKDIDILDGSPPCSVFSMAGERQKAWGKSKVFREGQNKQTLDDLFFQFIHTAEILKPKIIIAENVKGLITGKAKGYVNEIIKALKSADYVTQMFLLDASAMGVPQKRERVFFIAHRADLNYPKLQLEFTEPVIKFKDIRSESGVPLREGMMSELIKKRRRDDRTFNDISIRERGKYSMYTNKIVYDDEVAPTITAAGTFCRFVDGQKFSNEDLIAVQTFPCDYNFGTEPVQYVCGMSVPPVMMAQIASAIYDKWLHK